MFGKNLRYLREKNGLEQLDLAHQLGKKSTSSISEWESGKYTPRIGVLAEIAEIFSVDLDDLMNVDLSVRPSNVIDIKEVKMIPLIGEIAGGEPILAEQNISDHIAFPSELLPSGKLFFLRCNGKSMETAIKDGALVLIRKQSVVENNEIAAVLLQGEDEATLKRVKYIGKEIILMPDNEKFEPILLNEDSRAMILGKAIKVINDL